MSNYLLQGAFAMPQARMVNFKGEENQLPVSDMGVEIVWGLWEIPDADNDEGEHDGPEAA